MKYLYFLLQFNLLMYFIKSDFIEMDCDDPLVTIYIYSSQLNPQWRINSSQLNSFKTIRKQNNSLQIDEENHQMAYQGFSIQCSNQQQFFIFQNYFQEKFLFQTGKAFLSKQLIDYIEPFLGQKFSTSILPISKSFQKTFNCDHVPIKGPDYVPVYNPSTDNGGCFITRQSKNNCYAYATDIVTNTFPQPGRWNGRNPSSITCDSIRQASIRDGLIYKGLTLNENQPKLGHYLALFIWSNIDYHWIRKDANGYWSHKPGPGRVTNRDNRGLSISNPLKSNFTPWTKFCGFYIAQPSKVNIH